MTVPGKWVAGIELFEPRGKNDGSINMMSCKPIMQCWHVYMLDPGQDPLC